MKQPSTLPMESYRLAQYAHQIPCYICEEGNTFDAEYCRYCCAPMALAHQANSQKIHPRMMACLGASGAGKTVYLGMLIDMLSRQTQGLQLLARGAFSITLQQRTVAALARCQFPSKTPNEPDRWNWVHSQVKAAKQRRPVELIMPDMAGEAILQEVEHPHTYGVIQMMLRKCSGALVLVDAMQRSDSALEQDYFTMKLLSYLTELDHDNKTGWSRRPLAIVFTKADECEECFADPAAFAKSRFNGLWQHVNERFKHFKFFASGVAGACALRTIHGERAQRVPLRIEPRGVIEPFHWLICRV